MVLGADRAAPCSYLLFVCTICFASWLEHDVHLEQGLDYEIWTFSLQCNFQSHYAYDCLGCFNLEFSVMDTLIFEALTLICYCILLHSQWLSFWILTMMLCVISMHFISWEFLGAIFPFPAWHIFHPTRDILDLFKFCLLFFVPFLFPIPR